MLAAYLVWHLRKAWAPLCFADEAPPERPDAVAPAVRSERALAEVSRHTSDNGEALHSFASLLGELATLYPQHDRVRQRGPHHQDRRADPASAPGVRPHCVPVPTEPKAM
jgi:hypothetical protein